MARTAVVTGAASGIGRAVAQRLTRSGWHVFGLDRAPQRDPEIPGAVVDVLDEEALRAAVAGGVAELGGLDAMVCSAGISGSAYGDGPVATSSGAAFDAVVGTNLRGAFLALSAAWPALAEHGGSIVTISSVLGMSGGGGPFRSHAYIASKGGLIALTRALAAEGRSVGVRANCVAPGLVDTPLSGRAARNEEILSYVRDRQPLVGGPLDAADVAGAVEFLCSDAARAITGQVLAVDAGWGLDAE
ncbi:MAG TPA: SDR family NAD(P)-dependent oxidoreductase [Mycobacteriales bacterium]|nr:SDR family NAD(P)-dependent oxidoreductase [Mycobacteriales bacterium]